MAADPVVVRILGHQWEVSGWLIKVSFGIKRLRRGGAQGIDDLDVGMYCQREMKVQHGTVDEHG